MAFWNWLRRRNEGEPPEAAAVRSPPTYDIDNAIQLLRALPLGDNAELVLRVVRKTLQSLGVSIQDIVASATNREAELAAVIAQDRAGIEHLEREIAVRKANIDQAHAQLEETRRVRERLEDALQNETKIRHFLPQEELASAQAVAPHSVVETKAPSVSPPMNPGPAAVARSGPPPFMKRPEPPLPRKSGPPAPPKVDTPASLPSLADLSDIIDPSSGHITAVADQEGKPKP